LFKAVVKQHIETMNWRAWGRLREAQTPPRHAGAIGMNSESSSA